MEEPSDISNGQPMDEMVASDDEAEPAAEEFEDDPKRLIARQKQIDFGKNTIGYENYLKAVPKERRRKFGPMHDPPTPDITKKYSKKTWDGIVKAWRRHLHKFDNVNPDDVAPVTTTPVQPGSTSGAGTASLQAGGGPDVPAGGGGGWVGAARRWRHSKGAGRQQKQTPELQEQERRQQQGQPLEASPAMQQQQQADLHTDGAPDRVHDSSRAELDDDGESVGASGRQRSHVSSSARQGDRQYNDSARETSRYGRHERQRGSERPRNHSRGGLSGGREYDSDSSDRWRDSKGYLRRGGRRGKLEAPGNRWSSRDDRAGRDRGARGYRAEGSEQQQQQQQRHDEREREQDVWQYQGRPAGRSWADEVDQADADDAAAAAAGGGGHRLSKGEVDPRHGSSSSPQRDEWRSSRPHSRGQLTPAKRSSSQGRLDRRPLKSLH